MAKTIDIPIEPLTPQNFAPFGQVIGERSDKPHYSSPNVKTWAVDFEIEGKVELEFARFDYKPVLEFTRMERHYLVTQSFMPLANDGSVTVFAPPTDPDDPEAVPRPEDMKARYIDGTKGIMMWKGTWHSGRFPARPPAATFAFLTEANTTADLTAMQKGKGGRLTQIVDFQKKFGWTFRLTDPKGLMKG
jgi:ureidoglycolate hydrolase